MKAKKFRSHFQRAWYRLLGTTFLGACALTLSIEPTLATTSNSEVFVSRIMYQPDSRSSILLDGSLYKWVTDYVFDSLMTKDLKTNEWTPRLAKKITFYKKDMSLVVEIRQDAIFHDGQAVTAEDVKFSFDFWQMTELRRAYSKDNHRSIKKAQVISPSKISFSLARTDPLAKKAIYGLRILPKHIYAKFDSDKKFRKLKKIIGSGPYQFKYFKRGKGILLQREPKWWGFKDSYWQNFYHFPKIHHKYIVEDSTSFMMLEKGELHYSYLDPEDYYSKTLGPEWGKIVHKKRVKNLAPKNSLQLSFNLENPLFSDSRVRLALLHLMNRQLMSRRLRHNEDLLATGPWHQKARFSPKLRPVEYSPEKALKLLKQSGWQDKDKDGVLEKQVGKATIPFRFTLYYPARYWEKFFTLYAEDLKVSGIHLKIKFLEWSLMAKLMEDKKYDALLVGATTSFDDHSPRRRWHSENANSVAAGNYSGYSNPRVDELIDQLSFEWNQSKRDRLLKDIYGQIASGLPSLFVFDSEYAHYAVSHRVIIPTDTHPYGVGIDQWRFAE